MLISCVTLNAETLPGAVKINNGLNDKLLRELKIIFCIFQRTNLKTTVPLSFVLILIVVWLSLYGTTMALTVIK